MGIEEQREEREVLDSIYPDEITDISDTSYRVTITLEVPTQNDSEATLVTPPQIVLNVSYPDSYPDVGPNLDLTAPPNAPKFAYFDVSEDKTQLIDALSPTIEESLGMAMVYTLLLTLKELAETLIADRQRQQQEIKDIAAAKAEEEENRKFHGTAVTREKFVEWREKFMKEMADKEKQEKEAEEAEERKKRGGKPEEKKMTGRQLWEKGLVGKVDEEEDLEEAPVEGVKELKISA